MEQIAINGWVFNFKDMVAKKFTGEYGIKTEQFKVKDGRILKYDGETEFFPSKRLNSQAAEACATYHFEKVFFEAGAE
jgi:hypothetical protein